ncbi:MAG: hypothetical protein WCM93_12640, partial [Bacteroidota bacterium]
MKKNQKFTVLLSALMVFSISNRISYAQTWEPTNGPMGGGISCIAQSGSYLFAGTGGSGIYGNGAYRSADNGTTWTIAAGLPNLHALVVSGSYVVASAGGGIYRSSNNGDTWTPCSYSGTDVPAVLISNGTSLFAGGYAGLYTSIDNGLTWTVSTAAFPGLTAPNVPNIQSMAVCGSYLYLGTSQQGIFRSANNGATWTAINAGIVTNPLQLAYYTFANLVVSGTDVFAGAIGQGVYRLINNGTTWTTQSGGLTAEAKNVLTMAIKDNILYCGGNDGLWGSSTSGTLSWTQIKAGDQFRKLFVSGASLYTGLGSKGVYLSNDNGITWTSKNQGIQGLSTRKIIKGNGSEILAATYEGMLYSSVDEGANWTVGNIHAETGPCLHGTTLFADAYGDLYRSIDNGASWQKLPQFYDLTWGVAYSFYSKGDTIFVGGAFYNGVCYSTDNGDTWNETSGIWNLNPNGGAPTVISFTSIATTMYAGTINGVFKSEDNGITWVTCYPAMANIPISSVVYNGTYLFASTSNFYEDPNLSAIGIYRSGDNGISWEHVNVGLGSLEIKTLIADGTDLYAGTAAGIFKSTDNGDSWVAFNEGFPSIVNANSLYIEGNYIYADNWTVTTPVYKRALSGNAPDLPDAIVGSSTPCRLSSQIYSVTNVPGVTYAWQFPSGWVITAGGTTSSVTVTVGTNTGIVLVTPTNGWGSGPAQFLIVSQTLTTPNQPAAITGSATPLEGSIQNYSVTNVAGVSYAWTFPTGWVQTGGGTTNVVTVIVGSGSGNITVTPSTACGNGTARTKAVVTAPASKILNLTSVFPEGLYAGGGTLNQAFDENGPHWPAGVADHITVELHNAASYGTIAYSADVALSTTGAATLTVPADRNGSYYITIKHRNSLETVSATAK